MRIPFKLTTTGDKFNQDLSLETKFSELKNKINNEVFNNFGLREYDIVPVGSILSENGPAIDENSSISISRFFSENIPAFYIRPILRIISNHEEQARNNLNFSRYFRSYLSNLDSTNSFDCSICFQIRHLRSRRILNCSHIFCINCINRWMESNEINSQRNRCPICRSIIN